MRAFGEAINRAEVTGKVSRKAAAESLRAFEEDLGGAVASDKPTDELGEDSAEVLAEEISKEEKVTTRRKEKSGGPRTKVEARLESLARMYETKKSKGGGEETEMDE